VGVIWNIIESNIFEEQFLGSFLIFLLFLVRK